MYATPAVKGLNALCLLGMNHAWLFLHTIVLSLSSFIPANTTHQFNVGPVLDRRHRRHSIGPALGRCVVAEIRTLCLSSGHGLRENGILHH